MLHEVALVRPDAATIERIIGAPDGWRATLRGPIDASVDRGRHILIPAAPSSPEAQGAAVMSAPLGTTSGEAHVHAASGVRITVGRTPGSLMAEFPGGMPPGVDTARLMVDLRPEHGGALHVRTRRDGDRIRTPAGTRTLGDILGEVGVPRAVRDLMPVVSGADDHALWVPGVVVDSTAHDS
jgi:tRNA(Ile)-lysidine synthetase-like protein